MQFLHTVHGVFLNNLFNKHRDLRLFSMFLLVLKKMLFVLSLVLALKRQFNGLIKGKSQTNRYQKSNSLFQQLHDQS